MKYILAMHGTPGKIWLLYNKAKNKVHTVLTFEAESKVVYLELTPQSGKAWYGKELVYDDEQMFLQEFAKQNYEVSDVTDFVRIGQQPKFLLEKLK